MYPARRTPSTNFVVSVMKKRTETCAAPIDEVADDTAAVAVEHAVAKPPRNPRGRPLSFDRDAALEAAKVEA